MTHFIEELSAIVPQILQAIYCPTAAQVPTVLNEDFLNSGTANKASILTEAFPIIKLMHRRVCWGGSPD